MLVPFEHITFVDEKKDVFIANRFIKKFGKVYLFLFFSERIEESLEIFESVKVIEKILNKGNKRLIKVYASSIDLYDNKIYAKSINIKRVPTIIKAHLGKAEVMEGYSYQKGNSNRFLIELIDFILDFSHCCYCCSNTTYKKNVKIIGCSIQKSSKNYKDHCELWKLNSLFSTMEKDLEEMKKNLF